MDNNYFTALASVDVREHLEKKGQFTYLSWPFAVAELKKSDPTATWSVTKWDGVPYISTDSGTFVEVSVTAHGVTMSQIHPVLDGKNRPLQAPNAFDINTSIQRCLVKAIALHGLGLSIYAGEDLWNLGDDNPEFIDSEQQDTLRGMIADTNTDVVAFCNYLKVSSLNKIKATQFASAYAALEAKKRKAA